MRHPLPEDNAIPAADFLRTIASTESMVENSASYRLAFDDPDFLARPEVRGIRFQLELLKPDLILRENQIDHTIVVFGSARFASAEDAEAMMAQASDDASRQQAEKALQNSKFYESARVLGQLVARHNLSQISPKRRLHICTGGGPGIMAAANRGAHETGDLSIGLNIKLPFEQRPNPYLTPALCFQFHYFALRKMHFLLRARAIVVYPGGYGSFDELFEVLTLIQTKKITPMPVVLVGTDYWTKVVNFQMMAELGLIAREDHESIHFVDTAHDAWQAIATWYGLS